MHLNWAQKKSLKVSQPHNEINGRVGGIGSMHISSVDEGPYAGTRPRSAGLLPFSWIRCRRVLVYIFRTYYNATVIFFKSSKASKHQHLNLEWFYLVSIWESQLIIFMYYMIFRHYNCCEISARPKIFRGSL